MPIECDIPIKAVSQDQFHLIDKSVMRHAFDIHNSMGRFCDERIYHDELANRCRMAGIESQCEVEVRLTHGSFSKAYFIDLLAEHAVIYELKAVEALAPAHQNQLINYLLLTGTSHGKLLNLRSPSVQSRFVSTNITGSYRKSYRLNAGVGEPEDTPGINLKKLLLDLVSDWGTSLDINAYREALLHFTGGPCSGLLPVPIMSNGRIVGSQKMCLLDPMTGWHLSMVKSNLSSHEKHIRRLLGHTNLERLHWININPEDLLFKTLENDSVRK